MRGAARVLVLLALGIVGCGGTTGGHLLQVPFEAGGIARDASQPFTFVTEQGWTVTLTQAEVVLGPLYFNVIASQTVGFRSGVVIMQVTRQFIVDMLNPTLVAVPNGADGESGTAVSVEVGFFTAVNGYNEGGEGTIQLPAPLADGGQQGTAFLAGQASKGGVIVPFAGRVQITNALVTGLEPHRLPRARRGRPVQPDLHAHERAARAARQSVALVRSGKLLRPGDARPRAGWRRRRRRRRAGRRLCRRRRCRCGLACRRRRRAVRPHRGDGL